MSFRHFRFRQPAFRRLVSFRRLAPETVAWGLVALALCGPAAAQTDPPAATAAAQSADDAGAADAANDEAQPAANSSKPNREQTIYIPYTKLREVFEKEGRGVFLPYAEFQKLWNAAREKPAAPQIGPPVDALITEAENEASVEKDVVRVSARLTIELLKKGWLQIPLRLNGAALQSATIDGKAARVLPAAGGGYQLLLNNAEDKARSIELQLEYARAFTKSPGQNSVTFDAPQAPVNRWRIRVPQAGVKINVQPLIAASQVDAQPKGSRDSDLSEQQPSEQQPSANEETVVLAFVGAAPEVRIDWTPKADGAAGMTALATVQATQEVFINEGTLRARAHLRYDISRSSLKELTIEVPSDFKIVNVFDANLRKWEVTDENQVQRITIELFEPATTTQSVSIELEKFTDSEEQSEVDVPVVKAVDVGRQQGIVVVNVDPALRAEVTARSSLLQLDAAELPANLKGQPWNFAYRYAALPMELTLSLVKVEPRITVEQIVEATIEPELVAIDMLAVFDVAEAGIFQLEFDLPEGFEVRQVRGQEVAGATAASVAGHHLDEADETHLVISLDKKALGKTAVVVQLEKRLNDTNLLSPTGTASSIPIALPRASQAYVTRVTGRMVLYAPESLRINPTATQELRAISLSEAMTGLQSVRGARSPNTRPALSFAFTDQAADLTLSVERRKPYVTARQRLTASVDSGVVRFQSLIIYDILYSGIAALRIDVPADIAANIQNETEGMRESPMEPQPDDVATGYVAWKLTGQSELIGRQTISFSWEQKIDELSVGKSTQVVVPHLRPMEVDRSWGQIVLVKAENLDVQPASEMTGLRPIDPQHDIMPDAKVADAARAFEFHDDWSLKLNITRYQLEEIKHTSIERALVRMVVTRSSQVGVQALYRLRSAHQRLTIKLPKDVEFDTQPARIDGQPVGLERGDKDELYLPLSGHDPDRPLVLELRYTSKASTQHFDLPQFPEDPAVQKVYLNLFLPRERTLIGSTGPWTEEWTWESKDLFGWQPVPTRSDEELASWITEGINVAASPPFQRDGTLYVFSALKPQPPPTGSLRITTVNDKLFATIAFALLAALALALMRSPLRTKVASMAGLLTIVILIGVLAPSLAQQLIGLPTFAGLALVAIAWLGWYGYHAAGQWEHWQRAPASEAVPGAENTAISAGESAAAPLDDAAGAEDTAGNTGGDHDA